MGMMEGKKGLVVGVANEKSIAWGIAQAAAREGAELAFTYAIDQLEKRVRPLAESVGSTFVHKLDVTNDEQFDHVFAQLKEHFGTIDFIVHAVAFSDKEELKGPYYDTSRKNFANTMDISVYSFTAMAKRAVELMPNGGVDVDAYFLWIAKSHNQLQCYGRGKGGLRSVCPLSVGRYGAKKYQSQRSLGRTGKNSGLCRDLRFQGDVAAG